ncbi:MAG: nickel-responsive transcriptional regulator NikR [Candidatus Omnitrophica bacterium]|nr:nickel-responsive transcriptional regulator NikR [Candidatus Omnitrophota bacterium]
MPAQRFGVSIPPDLLKQLDDWVRTKGYPNRSEALRTLVREGILHETWVVGKGILSGAVTLVYDHHRKETLVSLNELQHDFHELIVSSQHVHLDHTHCLEIVVVRGRAPEIRRFADRLRGIKGVVHDSLTITTRRAE